MKIHKPKYKVGEKVWLKSKDDGEILQCTIMEINAWTWSANYNFDNVYHTYQEKDIFKTKKEAK